MTTQYTGQPNGNTTPVPVDSVPNVPYLPATKVPYCVRIPMDGFQLSTNTGLLLTTLFLLVLYLHPGAFRSAFPLSAHDSTLISSHFHLTFRPTTPPL
jgi:hypothetical protein